MKIVVVGGGSTYTPELIDGIAQRFEKLPVRELVLVDPAADRLDLVGPLGQRMFLREGHPGTVRWTSDLVGALEGASFVLLQLRIGGQAARHTDETFPLECDCVGQETTGPGGMAKALRTVPEVLRIAEAVRKHAPDAWIVDFTNPVGIVTRALLQAGHRAVGLCNVAIGFQRMAAAALKVDPARISLDHVGLNHLTWERAIRLDGNNVLPELLDRFPEAIEEKTQIPIGFMREMGFIPSYYLRYYYQHNQVVRQLKTEESRATVVARVEEELLKLYADPALDTKPQQLQERGGAFYSEAAVDLISSLYSDKGDVQVVNLANQGLFPSLPDDAVIEVPATITSSGPAAVPTAPLQPLLSGLVSHVTSYEFLALDAALYGGRERVFKALMAHPLVGQIDLAHQLTDQMIALNRPYLSWAQ